MFLLGSTAHRQFAAVGGYIGNGVRFDGANDYLLATSSAVSPPDSKQFTISVWYKFYSDATSFVFGNATSIQPPWSGLGFYFQRQAAVDRWALIGNEPSGTRILQMLLPDNSCLADSTWHHIIVSCDMTDTAKRYCYLDDSIQPDSSFGIYIDGFLDFTKPEYSVGMFNDAQKINGELADLYFTDEYIDLSVQANREKFRSAVGCPVDLGSDGSNPTGTAARVLLSGSTATWHTNDGTEGGFTEFGALTDASDNPC